MVEVFGITNCDTVKKAVNWLKDHHISFVFHDFKKEGISHADLEDWINRLTLDKVLNKKSTTYRSLDPLDQKRLENKRSAIKVMQEQTSLIKRPVIVKKEVLLNGFDETKYSSLLLK